MSLLLLLLACEPVEIHYTCYIDNDGDGLGQFKAERCVGDVVDNGRDCDDRDPEVGDCDSGDTGGESFDYQ